MFFIASHLAFDEVSASLIFKELIHLKRIWIIDLGKRLQITDSLEMADACDGYV